MEETEGSVKPISPHDIFSGEAQETVPDIFIVVFNELIEKHYDGIYRSSFTQKEFVDRLVQEDIGIDLIIEYISRLWPLFKQAYINAGWIADYEPYKSEDNLYPRFTFDRA